MKVFVANYLVEHHHLLLPSDVLQLQQDLLFPQGLKPEPHEPTLQEVDTLKLPDIIRKILPRAF